jgi:hypothetical protein
VIDYGAIALIAFLAALFLLGSTSSPYQEDGPFPVGMVGLLLALLAVKLLRDVRRERRGN